MTFVYGGGKADRSIGVVDMPCIIAGRQVNFKLHVVSGEAPPSHFEVHAQDAGRQD